MRVIGTIWLVSIIVLGFVVDQNSFILIFFGYGTAFMASYFLISAKSYSFRDLIVLGLLARLLLFFSTPSLSDDIYRFVWDGRLIMEGLNPYAWTPSMVQSTIDANGLYENLNSKDYYSVYPVVCQSIFLLATWLSGASIFWSGFIIKIFLLIADLGIFRLLVKWMKSQGKDPKRALWFLLNPLVVIETFGNLHFEVIMIFFMMFALTTLRKPALSAIALAGGIASKLLPALAIPLIIFKLNVRNALKYLTLLVVIGLVLFSPILFTLQDQGFSESINLYFQTFEFNASLYYLVREVGYFILGYNAIHVIGPLMAVCSGIIILVISYNYRSSFNSKWPEALLFIFTVYFMFATTVHPWYILTPLVFSLMTNYNYAILWSALVPLSYHAYSFTPVRENMYLIGLEYLVIMAFFFYEYKNPRQRSVEPDQPIN